MTDSIKKLCQRLGHNFECIELAELALTHRSKGKLNNERLEFLGDAILSFVIAEELFQRFPRNPNFFENNLEQKTGQGVLRRLVFEKPQSLEISEPR